MLEQISRSDDRIVADSDRSTNEDSAPSVMQIRSSLLTEDDIEAYTMPEDPFFG